MNTEQTSKNIFMHKLSLAKTLVPSGKPPLQDKDLSIVFLPSELEDKPVTQRHCP